MKSSSTFFVVFFFQVFFLLETKTLDPEAKSKLRDLYTRLQTKVNPNSPKTDMDLKFSKWKLRT